MPWVVWQAALLKEVVITSIPPVLARLPMVPTKDPAPLLVMENLEMASIPEVVTRLFSMWCRVRCWASPPIPPSQL